MAAGLSVYFRRYLSDREALVAALAHPVLVWEASSPKPEEPVLGTETSAPMRSPRGGEPVVYELKKAQKLNAFAMGVTVGRIDSNDVVMEDPSVSRFHAYFQRDARTGDWSLVDADSKNGTWAGPLKLSSNARARVTDGTKVRFGDVEAEFLLPATLLVRFEKAMRASPPP